MQRADDTIGRRGGSRRAELRQFPPGYGNMCFGRARVTETVASKSGLLRLLIRGFASIEFQRRQGNQCCFIEMNHDCRDLRPV